MELEAALLEAFRERYATTTLTSQDVGVKHWIIFHAKVLRSTNYLLIPLHVSPPTSESLREAEYKLLLFAMYLSRSYPGSTVGQYIFHVKARHYFWLGFTDFRQFETAFFRLPILLRVLNKRSPGPSRVKKPLTKNVLRQLWVSIGPLFLSRDFECMVFWGVCTMAFQQLLRLNEVVLMTVKSQANKFPIPVSDITFFDSVGNLVPKPGAAIRFLSGAACDQAYKSAVAWESIVAFAVVIAPPTKADPTAKNDPYYLPMSAGEAKFLCPCWVLWRMLAAFPVPAHGEQQTALFRASPKPLAKQIGYAAFHKLFRAACRKANVQYAGYGKHCFRVGGLNALQDAGCSVPQLMAMGHWKSDAWTVYARRSRLSLMHYNNLMLR